MPPLSQYERILVQLNEIEQRFDRLKIEYKKFFVGAIDFEPVRMREEIGKDLRSLNGMFIANTGLRFRARALLANFNTYQEMWTRYMREVLEGRRERGRAARVDVAPRQWVSESTTPMEAPADQAAAGGDGEAAKPAEPEAPRVVYQPLPPRWQNVPAAAPTPAPAAAPAPPPPPPPPEPAKPDPRDALRAAMRSRLKK